MKNFIVLIFFLAASTVSMAQSRPNILWITIEDTSPQFIGCYGNKDARTPVIDRLASEGVRFTNAFSTGTVCSPSRTTLITGVRTYEAGTGNHRSNYPVPDYMHGFPYFMQQAGYYTTNNSKTDYNVRNPTQFIKTAWNESSGKAGWWDRKPGQPFFAVFNYNDSHQSRTMTDAYPQYVKEVLAHLPEGDQIGENDFAVPPIYRDSPEMRKQLARVYNAIKLTDNKVGELMARLEADGLRDSTIIFFYADHGEGIPRGKTNGINLGYRVPFVVWFPPMYRHLSPWGESGVVTDELVSFEDLAPTMISLAGGQMPSHMKGRILMGKQRSAPVSHLTLSSDRSDNGIDMVRSVTDGRYMYSRNYMPYMPEVRYIRYMEIGDIKQQMRTDYAHNQLNDLQRSLFGPRPAESLYDLDKDIWETTNLIDDPSHKDQTSRMRNYLEVSLGKSRDILFLPEYELALISKKSTPYEYRLDDVRYPYQEIYKAAGLSGVRTKSALKEQLRLTKASDPIVRYWALLGLRAQPRSAWESGKNVLTAALNDTYPPVSLLASSILTEFSAEPQAVEQLKQYCQSNNPELALMAINELLYLTDRRPFVETVRSVHEHWKAQAERTIAYKVRAACMDVLGSLGLVPNNPTYSE